MLTLYASPVSLYCAKLRILLRHKRLQWLEVSPEGGYNAPGFRERVPTGTMPAIEVDGLVLADSEAIAEYLDETVTDPAMLPPGVVARARCRERSRFHDTRLEPEVRKLFPHVGTAARGSDIVSAQSTALNQRLEELSRLLVADSARDATFFCLGDCGFPVSFAWMDAFATAMGLELEWPPNVIEYRRQLESFAAVEEELVAYAPAMRDWLQSKTPTN